MSDVMKKLEQAKRLLDLGVLTPEEYEKKKAKYLSELGLGEENSLASINASVGGNNIEGNPLGGDQGTRIGGDPFGGNIFGGDPLSGDQGTIVGAVATEIGQYRILGLLGEGGMGSVYKARHKNERIAKMRGDVAVKLIKGEYARDPQLRERFVQEAGLGMKIKHPNIADVIDFYEDENQIAFIMEFVEGVELKDKIPSGGLPIEDTISYLKPIAEAVDYLHAQNIIHRDLKPANVKIKPDGTPIILDFGIAKDTSEEDSGMTSTGMAMGTQAYMAPEQLDAKNVDGRADQYALCMMAYEMLSGSLPWEVGESSARIGMRKLGGSLKSLAEVSSVRKEIDAAIMKGLSVEKRNRYENCVSFIQSLVDIVSGPSEEEREAARIAEDARLAREATRRAEEEARQKAEAERRAALKEEAKQLLNTARTLGLSLAAIPEPTTEIEAWLRGSQSALAKKREEVEADRQAESEKLAEESRKAEEVRKAEESRLAEEKRQAEERRQAEEERALLQREEEERRLSEEKERRAQQAQAESERLAEEARKKSESKLTTERSRANDPSKAAQTEQAEKYWLMALADMDAERFESAIMNIKFAQQFERSNEVFQEWLQKAQKAAQEAEVKNQEDSKRKVDEKSSLGIWLGIGGLLLVGGGWFVMKAEDSQGSFGTPLETVESLKRGCKTKNKELVLSCLAPRQRENGWVPDWLDGIEWNSKGWCKEENLKGLQEFAESGEWYSPQLDGSYLIDEN